MDYIRRFDIELLKDQYYSGETVSGNVIIDNFENIKHAVESKDTKTICCLCCKRGPVLLHCSLERSAYCCGEYIRLTAHVNNQTPENVWLTIKLQQNVEYYIDRGVLGLNKDALHTVMEFRGPNVGPISRYRFDDYDQLQLPIVPPTLSSDICRLIQISYSLKICMTMEESGDDMHMEFPIVVATMPYRVPSATPPAAYYGHCSQHVEGGMYISPEFQLGQVYDGSTEDDNIILYRPTYVHIKPEHFRYIETKPTASSRAPLNGTPSSIKEAPSSASASSTAATAAAAAKEEGAREKDNASTSKILLDGIRADSGGGGQVVKKSVSSSVQKQVSKTARTTESHASSQQHSSSSASSYSHSQQQQQQQQQRKCVTKTTDVPTTHSTSRSEVTITTDGRHRNNSSNSEMI
ncbi:PREDICTED: uncharacterized protein LOC106804925 [Priapulus caudatus]|uniref:Uncharacterized protein LOC106804925 n=1 Tax=Priapulus caudatus TaxID=37621 RepID=A0ABM1DPE8_PRICU|nr:PREDICTED: uncharacterized protein LOC106804925 [Priapulus caudatus]